MQCTTQWNPRWLVKTELRDLATFENINSHNHTEFIPLPTNPETDNSSTTTNQISENINCHIVTANGIFNLLKINKNIVNQQQIHIQEANTLTNTDQDISNTLNNLPTKRPLTLISDKQTINSEKLSKGPFGFTLIKKTIDLVRILFQNINGLELSSID